MIPAYNEEKCLPSTLGHTVEYLAAQPYSSAIVVVDDASTDGTADVVRTFAKGRLPVHLLRCRQPGKGSAVRAAS